MKEAAQAFLLGFPALFSIVNPIAGAFFFRAMTTGRSMEQRASLARHVALYSMLTMMGALWAGSFVLAFFGISLAALRVAGGVVVALTGWTLLNQPEQQEARKRTQIPRTPGSPYVVCLSCGAIECDAPHEPEPGA